jgi:hypothetical protein
MTLSAAVKTTFFYVACQHGTQVCIKIMFPRANFFGFARQGWFRHQTSAYRYYLFEKRGKIYGESEAYEDEKN